MLKVITKLAIGLCCSMLILSGCTRPKSEESSVSLSFPQTMITQKLNSSQSASEKRLGVIIMNVSGPGLAAPIYFSKQGQGEGAASMISPNVEIIVPKGDNRLFQVLAVYFDELGRFDFYYGSQRVNLQANEVTVPMVVSQLGSASGTGDISGRYLTTANFGPTGVIEAQLLIPNQPPFTIEKGRVLNGWFNSFGIIGQPMRYVINGSINIFSQTNLDHLQDIASIALDKSVVMAKFPAAKEIRRENFGGVSKFKLENSEARLNIIGFFGPGKMSSGSLNRFVCASASGLHPRLLRENTTVSGNPDSNGYFEFSGANIDADNNGIPDSIVSTQQLSFAVASAPGLFSGSDPSSNILISGPATPTDCTSPGTLGDYVTNISITDKNFTSGGSKSSAAFFLPLQGQVFVSGSSSYFAPFKNDMAGPGTTHRLTDLKLLPGSRILFDTVRVFKTNQARVDRLFEMGGGPTCEMISQGAFGFQLANSQSLPTTSEGTTFNIETGLSSAERNSASLVLCFSGSAVTSFAVPINNDGIRDYSSGSSGPVMANSISLSMTGTGFVNNFCAPVFIKGQNGSQKASFATGATLSITASSTGLISFFTDSSCTTAITSPWTTPWTIPNPESGNILIYYKANISNNTLGFTVSGAGSAANFVLYDAIGATPLATEYIDYRLPSQIKKFECYQILALPGNLDSGMGYRHPNNFSSNTITPFPTDFAYYNNDSCFGTSLSSVNVFSGDKFKVFSFKYIGSVAGSLSYPAPTLVTAKDQSFNEVSGPMSLTIEQPTAPTQMMVSGPNSLSVANMTGSFFEIRYQDSMGRLSADTSNSNTISLSGSASIRICSENDSTCSGSISTITVNANNPIARFKVRALSNSGNTTLSVTSSPSLNFTSSLDLQLNP